MPDIVFDSDFVTATAIGPLLYSAPIPGVATQYVVTQEFCQKFENYSPIAIGTVHPSLASFYLADESPLEDIGGGVARWRRTYSKVPAAHSEYSTISYQFIGFYGSWGVNVTTITGRERFTKTVPCRIDYAYYLTGVTPYTTASDITLIPAQAYYYGTDTDLATDYLADSPPFASASNPSRAAYENMIAAGDEIAVEMSSIERWMGNVYVRKTPYVVAQ